MFCNVAHFENFAKTVEVGLKSTITVLYLFLFNLRGCSVHETAGVLRALKIFRPKMVTFFYYTNLFFVISRDSVCRRHKGARFFFV